MPPAPFLSLLYFMGFFTDIYMSPLFCLFVAPEGRKARKGGWLIACTGPHSVGQAHRQPDPASLVLNHQPSPRLKQQIEIKQSPINN